eukprot:GEMP01079045.1.p1 GENE.GEMP01079045.1~~GEMP01079045.1.p1  ORF type:complete len:172 (+),score=36.04 GEMP01079045.1:88-603(+)
MNTDESGVCTGDLRTQWKWHESFRDASKNMYRTSYTDMIHGREVSVTSDFPSGYGGHIPAIRHDILFRNTGFDRTRRIRQCDFSRDSFPDFSTQIAGRAAEAPPPVDRQLQRPTPWAITAPIRKPPTFRTTPFRFNTPDYNAEMLGTADKDAAPGDTVDPMSKTMPLGFQW